MYRPEWLVLGVQSRTTSTCVSASSDDADALLHPASRAAAAARARIRVRMDLLGGGASPRGGQAAERVDEQEEGAGQDGDADDGHEDLVDVVRLARALDEDAEPAGPCEVLGHDRGADDV